MKRNITNNLSETDLYKRLLRLEDHVLDGRTPEEFNTDQFVSEANLAARDEIDDLAPVTSVDGKTGDVTVPAKFDPEPILAEVNTLYQQAAKHDFELALNEINYRRGDFDIYATSEDILSQSTVDVSLREKTSTEGFVTLPDGEVAGSVTHDLSRVGIQPDNVLISDDATLPPNTDVTYEIYDMDGNSVSLSRSDVDSEVDVSTTLTSEVDRLVVTAARSTTGDDTPQLNSWGAYFDGTLPAEWVVFNQPTLGSYFAIPDAGLKHQYETLELDVADGTDTNWPDAFGTDDLTAQAITDNTSNTGSQPTFRESDTDFINDTPILEFTDDEIGVDWSDISSPIHIFFVGKPRDTTATSTEYIIDSFETERSHGLSKDTNGNYSFTSDGGNYINIGTAVDTNPHLFEIVLQDSDSVLILDETTIASDTSTNIGDLVGLVLGNRFGDSRYWDFNAAACLIYDSSASGFDQTKIRNYLYGRYGDGSSI